MAFEQLLFCAQANEDLCERVLCTDCKELIKDVIAYIKLEGKPVRSAADARYRKKNRKELAAKNIERYRNDPTTWENYRRDNRETINKKAKDRYYEKKVAQSTGN